MKWRPPQVVPKIPPPGVTRWGLAADSSVVLADRIAEILPEEYETCSKRKTVKIPGKTKRPTVTYYNGPVTFDIETTNVIINGEKVCFMYCWQLWVNGHVVMGRTWDQFRATLKAIMDHFGAIFVPIYVHNLAFEFSFMKQVFRFDKVFCAKPRTPLYADYGTIEFRDSLALSGMKLENLGTKTKKLVGDLDYDLVRTPETPLTYEEIQYCKNDVIVLAEYIASKLEADTTATIPLTRTGYVRRDCKDRMKEAGAMRQVKYLSLTMDQYEKLRALFTGGFTHAAPHTCGQTIAHVRSLDITSSYPTVMVAEAEFPISRFHECSPKTRDELIWYLNNMCCMFRLELVNPRLKYDSYDAPISESKCISITPPARVVKEYEECVKHNPDAQPPRPVIANGRVVEAGALEVWANEIDFEIINMFYNYDECYIYNMEVATKGRLPKPLVEAVLYYYNKKTELKGAESKEDKAMYDLMKQYVNGIYGSTVTTPLKEPIFFDDGDFSNWCKGEFVDPSLYSEELRDEAEYERMREAYKRGDVEDMKSAKIWNKERYRYWQLREYNDSHGRYLYYAWGVWVTSLARRNLFTMMHAVGVDYHYSDTDSLKITNWMLHKHKFDEYNAAIIAKIKTACEELGIDPALATPKERDKKDDNGNVIPGKVRPLGIWTDEGEYDLFKTLGAKRYMTSNDGVVTVTVAGFNKDKSSEYFNEFKNPFVHFTDKAVIPADKSGKLIHTYIDHDWEGDVTDYLGNTCHVHAPGGCHLMATEASMTMSGEYVAYLARYYDYDTNSFNFDSEWVDNHVIK